MDELKRRGISGVYIFDKFPTDKKRMPTCVEDCQQSTRREWCMTKSPGYLFDVIVTMSHSLIDLVDFCHQQKILNHGEAWSYYLKSKEIVESSKSIYQLKDFADKVDYICVIITKLADAAGVTKHYD